MNYKQNNKNTICATHFFIAFNFPLQANAFLATVNDGTIATV